MGFLPGPWMRPVGWLLLVAAVATFLTNAYYLRFLEPVVSRRFLAVCLLGSIGLFFFVARVGLPRTREDVFGIARRLAVPALLVAILAWVSRFAFGALARSSSELRRRRVRLRPLDHHDDKTG